MTYQEYIDLGFKRGNLDDTVMFKQVGYDGFYLTKKLNKYATIEAAYPLDEDCAKLYIKKGESEDNLIIHIDDWQVKQLCK
jgi:hypothetical protein